MKLTFIRTVVLELLLEALTLEDVSEMTPTPSATASET
jgi:hypothetical protein